MHARQPAKRSSEHHREDTNAKRRRLDESHADEDFTMFVYFMGQSGFGNRMMSLVSALWLCILAKIPKTVILEEPCAWCPGSVNEAFELPAHMRTVGIQSIELVTLTKENRDSWLNWADEMCADRKAVPLRMFHHPRFTPKYVLAAMDRQHASHHALGPAEGRENRKRGDGKSDVLAERGRCC